MAIEAEALQALEKAREELIVREARRREILDWLQEETGTDWKCTRCGYTTYHSCAVSCAECDEPFPFLNTLAFKLHANGTQNAELIETVRAEFDAEQAFLPDPDLIHRSALAEDTARAAEGWEPIETAPKGRKPDGTMQFALLCAPYPTSTQMWSDIYQCWWNETEERWMRWPHPFPPTLWMPSPAMPEGKPSGSSIVLRQLSDEEKRERAAALADARKRERSALPTDKEIPDANR